MDKENEKKVEIAENADIAALAGLAETHQFLPDCIYQNLPEPLNEIVTQFTDRERDLIFLSSLGVLSCCMPKVFGIYDHRKYSPNLYLFFLAPPASGKGVMSWSKILIEPIHDKLLKDSKQAIIAYKKLEDKENVSKPELQVKEVPANTSGAKFYHHLEHSHDGLLIFDTEADSLSNMLKQEWGNFSDVMRKAFHHEKIAISRSIDDRFYQIKNPKLSIVLSGTPNQLKPLIDSKENGLFSRFIFYYFDDVLGWKDVSPNAEYIDYDELFSNASKEIYDLYFSLFNHNTHIEVKLTPEQWDKFQDRMIAATDILIKNKKTDFLSVVKRLGVIFFRVCLILTVLRNKTNISINDPVTTEYICSDTDMNTAVELIKSLIDHSLFVFDLYNKNSTHLPMLERALHSNLPKTFSRAESLVIAKDLGFAERTFADILNRWQKLSILRKIGHGKYEKLKLK